MSERAAPYNVEIGPSRSTSRTWMHIAYLILTKWPRRDPTITELRDHFGMSRATAYRNLRALRDARGHHLTATPHQGHRPMITPVIGERYRDTARDLSNITHLDRFDASRQRDAEREEILMAAILPRAKRLHATVDQVEQARAAGNQLLARDRSIASAISAAIKHLPQPQRKPTPPHAG